MDERLRASAVEYPAHGWGVQPGSVWDGERYIQGHTPVPTDGLVAVRVSPRSLRAVAETWSWWSVAPYAVLARTGEDFDVLTAPAGMVEKALHLPNSALRSCPIMLAPRRESARLLIRTGSRLWWKLRTVPEVGLFPTGALIALPPTVTSAGVWSWWVAPADCGYRPGLADEVQKTLGAVCGPTPGGRC
ncbi:hypothetical protein [Amycolatopsis vastitatis]|uniref:hypothetical protein n=1 Tax=Amycolatopsis vastitatis TaxID=1905142 RepID=UPI0011779F2B|nr:hypothetical protein [Amycolatopsis vastitatis]